MNMIVYSENEFRSGLWHKKAIEGIHKAAAKRGISITETDDKSFSPELFGDEKRLLTIIGASDRHMDELIPACRKSGVRMLFVNYEPRTPSHDSSQVIMDYSDTMERILAYFTRNGRTKPALLGVNPDSASDRRKADFMLSRGMGARIFYNDDGIGECVEKFLSVKDRYDSLVFTNDVFMLAASARLREAGIRVPEELWVVSFSDTMLSPVFESPLSPGISTFAIDYEELGRQCVELWNYLSRNPSDICATVRVRAGFFPNASTEFKEPEGEIDSFLPAGKRGDFDFYSDETVGEITRLENCLIQCDDTDFRILDSLTRGENRVGVAMKLYISEGTLYYRLRRLCRLAGQSTISELIGLIKKYFV